MECRSGCGACCIEPSITSPIPGMSNGKPAGMPCIHLKDDYSCGIYDSPDRPKACDQFQAEEMFCGSSREEALSILANIENSCKKKPA